MASLPVMRSCFAGLANGLRDQLAHDTESAVLFEYHHQRIAGVFACQPDLPLHQDSVGGFLHGFLTAAAHLIPDGSIQQQTTFPVLGGTLLLAQHLPIPDTPATAGRPFIDRLADELPQPAAYLHDDLAIGLVTAAFDIAGDIPVTCASLGGFCLGVLYTLPWLPDGTDPTALIIAACHLALHIR